MSEALKRINSLSPSRANDFKTCPLLYRYKTIDRLPEPPSTDALRGTIVHEALERIYDLPQGTRAIEHAHNLMDAAWANAIIEDASVVDLFADQEQIDIWLSSGRELINRYFQMEDPNNLEPAEREVHVEFELSNGLLLHGYVDRLDQAVTGELRIVDYKTGKSPKAGYEEKAFFQLKFYALVIWRSRGVLPKVLKLIYLGNSETLPKEIDESDLLAVERSISAIWLAIRKNHLSGNWPATPSRLCDWCSFKQFCPEFGGTLLPLPLEATSETLS
ncbi:PD-(D/E)XK nuclease superfamily protein [mine drainage metagenome]|uniref:PD-(D/E)XK nuclease superfamily protein n=1 Tax=mine drainage metagenome TaxID=410659 RepID=A0A1J5QNH8_9ZZZZ